MKTSRRLLLLLPAGAALLAGLDAALLLLGLPAPVTTDRLPQVHGALLVLGFLGTLIAAERAVALRRPWGFAAPVALGLGGLALLSPAPLVVGQALLLAGTLAQLGVYRALWRRQESRALALEVLGAVLAAGSALLWLGGAPLAAAVPWFAGYLVLTIAGERLELARVGAPGEGSERAVLVAGVVVAAAVAGTTLWPAVAQPALGAAVVGLVAVLLRHDVARRTVRATGLPRYMAWCLLGGYAWLAVAAATWLAAPAPLTEGAAYDAVIHAVFLGFTMSMVMAHAPVILPAVLAVRLPYHPVMFVPVAVLHASLALRILVGDLREVPAALAVGGALNVAAVLLFVVVAATSAVVGTRRRRPTSPSAVASPAPPAPEREVVTA